MPVGFKNASDGDVRVAAEEFDSVDTLSGDETHPLAA